MILCDIAKLEKEAVCVCVCVLANTWSTPIGVQFYLAISTAMSNVRTTDCCPTYTSSSGF